MSRVLVTGGAGYVGVELVYALVENGYDVVVYDLFWFSEENIFGPIKDKVTIIRDDIRNTQNLIKTCESCDSVIHLACISNDPSYYLDPSFSKEINYDCFEDFVVGAKNKGVKKFIFASSSSVYGVKEEEDVHEGLSLDPLTDYSKYKALCEKILLKYSDENFCTSILRPATVCGVSRRQRLDVVVNILTNHAITNGKIKVFGGEQKRPNIHIKDMIRAYLLILKLPSHKVNQKVYNVSGENYTVNKIAELVSEVSGVKSIEVISSDDNRSYHISAKKIEDELGFLPEYPIKQAVEELAAALNEGQFIDPLNNLKYFNVKFLKKYLEI